MLIKPNSFLDKAAAVGMVAAIGAVPGIIVGLTRGSSDHGDAKNRASALHGLILGASLGVISGCLLHAGLNAGDDFSSVTGGVLGAMSGAAAIGSLGYAASIFGVQALR